MEFKHQINLNADYVADYLAHRGIKPTQQRVSLGKVLFEKKQHISAEDILHRVNNNGEKISKATVYNTLGLFVEKGLLREVIIDASKTFYDTNIEKHHHVYHSDTGKIEDIPANQIQISQLPELPDSTEIEDIDVIIRLRKS